MKKKIKKFDFVVFLGILFFLIFVFSSQLALAQDVNYASSANNGVASEIGVAKRDPSGVVANTNDGDTGTYWRRGTWYNDQFSAEAEFTIEIDFDVAAETLNEVKYWIDWYNYCKNSCNNIVHTTSCSIYYSGAWHEIGTSTNTPTIISGPWSDVTKVKIRLYNFASQNTIGFIEAGVFLYELEAFGPPPVVAPSVVTNDTADVQETSATLNGDITNTGGENADERGFEWGTSLGGPYPNSWTEPGSFGTGVFSHTVSGLNSGTMYYFRAKANNSVGWGYGEEKSFVTASPPPPPPTCEEHNVWGWAWSENIGWISFSCRNTMAAGAGVDYGVDIDPLTGLFSGYAWSENIGWISFEPAAGCPSGTCQAKLDLNTGLVSGWARALSPVGDPNAGGWDGWIKLRGIVQSDGSSYGVYLDSSNYQSLGYSEFREWAWGDVVVGWFSFNCSNTAGACGVSDYKVMTAVVVNNPPYVESLVIEYKEYCDFSPTGRVAFEWIYQDDDGDNQAQYNLQVATDAGFNSLVVDAIVNQPAISPGSNGTSAVSVVQSPTPQIDNLDIGYGDSYFWRVKVQDTAGSWSINWESGPSFITPSNSYPNPSFTWYPSNPPAGEKVIFTDKSLCYTGAANCKDDADTSYEWDFGDGSPTDPKKGDTFYTYLLRGDYNVRLGVTDMVSFGSDPQPVTCYQEENLTATLPLPTWKEIAPF